MHNLAQIIKRLKQLNPGPCYDSWELTLAQAASLERVVNHQGLENLTALSTCDGSVGVVFTHIYIGIEKDGYAHS